MEQARQKHRTLSFALLAGLVVAVCVVCLMPLAAARVAPSANGPRGLVAEVCVGVRYARHTQVGIGWISAQASQRVARPSPHYWKPGLTVCGLVPWTPLLREQGGVVFPRS